MLHAQTRAAAYLQQLRAESPGCKIALFSHGDIIRAVAAYYLGVPLDLFLRIAIDPGSITIIQLDDYGPKVLLLNQTADNRAFA